MNSQLFSRNILACCDAQSLASRIPSDSVALAYIDPPYHSARSYPDPMASGGPKSPLVEYTAMITGAISHIRRTLLPTGSICVHSDAPISGTFRQILDFVFGPENFLCEYIVARTAYGHAGRRIDHDLILHYAKSRHYTKRHNGIGGDTVWTDIAHTSVRVNGPRFSSRKPDTLLRRVLDLASDTEDLVFDPFCGSGTTAVVAQSSGRRWIAGDSDQAAITATKHRLLAECGQTPSKDFAYLTDVEVNRLPADALPAPSVSPDFARSITDAFARHVAEFSLSRPQSAAGVGYAELNSTASARRPTPKPRVTFSDAFKTTYCEYWPRPETRVRGRQAHHIMRALFENWRDNKNRPKPIGELIPGMPIQRLDKALSSTVYPLTYSLLHQGTDPKTGVATAWLSAEYDYVAR